MSMDAKYLVNYDTDFTIVEAYKTARLNMMFTKATGDRKAFVFTSCLSSEGKTTTCANMGVVFARIHRTLIIDADMRKSSIHKLMNTSNDKGLSTVLGRIDNLEDAIVSSGIPNLDILPAGPLPPNPNELLASDYLREIINNLEEKYDYIMIDSPPINVVSDAFHLNKNTAGIIFVVAEGITSHHEIKRAIKNITLSNGKVLGFIKVCCEPARNSYSYQSYSYKNTPSI
jgi:capsular exopolysaccharide synthesis family protein